MICKILTKSILITLTSIMIQASTPKIINRAAELTLPEDLLSQARDQKISIFKPTSEQINVLYTNYPDGITLFSTYPTIAAKFNTMVENLKTHPETIEFIRKVYTSSLDQIYNHLQKFYTTLNLTYPYYNQATQTVTGSTLLTDNQTYGTTAKKIAVHHLVNLTICQLSKLIISYIPTTPPTMAAAFGGLFLHNDCGINFTDFTTPQTDPIRHADQKKYIDSLRATLDFFKAYTQLLYQKDSHGTNQYYLQAKNISSQADQMQPIMFFYDIESMRSINYLVNALAQLDPRTKPIGWPITITQAAIDKKQVAGHPVAYFKDDVGNKTTDPKQAKKLYFLVATGPNLFEQELIEQPAWMTSTQSSMQLLEGILGNSRAVVGLGILDATLESIINQATADTSDGTVTTQLTYKK